MDEKTESLRDIFLDVAGEDTVTESQTESRGSLAPDGESVDDRLAAVITTLRETVAVESDLPTADLVQVVRAFYAGETDEEIAAHLECTSSTVFSARMDLHLVRERDLPPDEVAGSVDAGLEEGSTTDALADRHDVSAETAEQYAAAVEANRRARRVSHRFRVAFEEILTDADLSVQYTAGAHDDGLDDATAGAEVDVDF